MLNAASASSIVYVQTAFVVDETSLFFILFASLMSGFIIRIFFRHINGKRIVFSLKIIGRFFYIFRCVIFVPKLIMAILFGWKSHI